MMDVLAPAATSAARSARWAPWVALASAALLLVAVAGRPQGLHFYDQALQATALRQWDRDVSPNLNTLVRVDPADLTRDLPEWLAWWPPSLQVLAAPLLAAGFTIGPALRIVFGLSLLVGAAGWACWMRRFPLPGAWVYFMAASLPWLRVAAENAFRYSAEILSFALAPWLLLAVVRLPALVVAGTTCAATQLAAIGLLLGASYLAKYSLFVFTISALLFVGWDQRRAWCAAPHRVASLVGLVVLATATFLLPLAWRGLNAHHGSGDPTSFAAGHAFDPLDLVYAVANPALALADAQGPLFHAFVFPGILRPPVHLLELPAGSALLAWIGLPAGGFLAWLLFRAARQTDCDFSGRLAAGLLALNTLALLLLWQCAEVDRSARHFTPAALAALPLAVHDGLRAWQRTGVQGRVVLAGLASAFVVGPMIYGFVYVGTKVATIPADYRTGQSGLYLPRLSLTDVSATLAAARPFWNEKSVWLVEDPEMALELPGRSMVIYGDRDVGHELRRLADTWRRPGDLATSRPMRLLLLLQRRGGTDQERTDLAATAAAIGPVTAWQRVDLPAGNCTLWVATLSPGYPATAPSSANSAHR